MSQCDAAFVCSGCLLNISARFVVVQLLSHVRLSATPWTAAHQAFLSFTLPEFAPNEITEHACTHVH